MSLLVYYNFFIESGGDNMILDWSKYIDKAVEVVSEGIVMLRNDNRTLPLDISEEIAVFGRIQFHYYKSGTGSGGMVNVSNVTGILDGLIQNNVNVNKELLSVYKKWDEENLFETGEGWGNEPWSQKEMPVDDDLVKRISLTCSTAIVIIGRTAGEEQDNINKQGSYLLSEIEKDMIRKVRSEFKKVIVLLNVGGLIDIEYIESCHPDSLLYVWHGGMTGGTGTADVLTGKVSPSGKLTDTIAKKINSYPSSDNFGDIIRNFYKEDIYVGYRYFETFAKEDVLYPFGYGLSYTDFTVKTISSDVQKDKVSFVISVENTGTYKGKEVVQIYSESPQGKLGKPLRVLCGFTKTRLLNPSEKCIVKIDVRYEDIASFDDTGITGYKSCFVLEQGEYKFYIGTDVRNAEHVCSHKIDSTVVTQALSVNLAPVLEFDRIKPVIGKDGSYKTEYEKVPAVLPAEDEKRLRNIPGEIEFTGDKGIKLKDVLKNKNTMEEFIAQFTDYDLSCIVRGEGMSSPKVTPGTASAFGGVSENLKNFGIPCCCCADGPSGMRLDCGTKAFSMPNGTMIASTFNPQIAQELFEFTGLEMGFNNVECLLGPGINIHRHPLNGRNFEYFSEDPLLTGTMASAILKGLHSTGATGTIKHFCGNNQETQRSRIDSVISQRALREIYLKGFQIAVKEGNADSIMTTYGAVNGLWTAGSYDLTTEILRKEWGFDGIVMTDWWADINERNMPADKTNYAAMIRAQNDLYMVCSNSEDNNDNILSSLENGTLKRSELQRTASNICRFIMNTNAMKRFINEYERVEIINRPDSEDVSDIAIEYYEISDGVLEIMGENINTKKGTSYSFEVGISDKGFYNVTITASSEQSELAQIPVTFFNTGSVCGMYIWNGTDGKPVSITKNIAMFSRFNPIRLYFAQNGLKIHKIRFELVALMDCHHVK